MNRFLAALPSDVAARITADARTRVFEVGAVVARAGAPFEEIAFPIAGAISEVEEGVDGTSAEVTVVGPEGISALEALLDLAREPFTRRVEVRTTVLALGVDAARRAFAGEPAFHALVVAYAGRRLRSAGISIACNARHPAPARCARWLLRLADRAGSTDFSLTHATIARMLGVRRETVTRAVAELAAAGAIATRRTGIAIADRLRLEALTCSCYPESREIFDELYQRARPSRERFAAD